MLTENATLVVEVESLQAADHSSLESNKQLYLQAMMQFYSLVLQDFDGILTSVKKRLIIEYQCLNVEVDAEESLVIKVVYNKKCVVALQCDHSSGQLANLIQQSLVSKPVLHELALADLKLNISIT